MWDSCSLRILEKKTSIPASFPSENRSEDKEAVRPRVAPVLGLGEVLSLLDLLSSGPHRELLGWWREGSWRIGWDSSWVSSQADASGASDLMTSVLAASKLRGCVPTTGWPSGSPWEGLLWAGLGSLMDRAVFATGGSDITPGKEISHGCGGQLHLPITQGPGAQARDAKNSEPVCWARSGPGLEGGLAACDGSFYCHFHWARGSTATGSKSIFLWVCLWGHFWTGLTSESLNQ